VIPFVWFDVCGKYWRIRELKRQKGIAKYNWELKKMVQIVGNLEWELLKNVEIRKSIYAKPNETKRNQTKRNETDRNETKRRYISFRFVRFRFVSFLFRFALYRYPISYHINIILTHLWLFSKNIQQKIFFICTIYPVYGKEKLDWPSLPRWSQFLFLKHIFFFSFLLQFLV
jgi:hypothetical protein